jgi:hypothetical protein
MPLASMPGWPADTTLETAASIRADFMLSSSAGSATGLAALRLQDACAEVRPRNPRSFRRGFELRISRRSDGQPGIEARGIAVAIRVGTTCETVQ